MTTTLRALPRARYFGPMRSMAIAAATVAVLALVASPALAATPPVYSNIPSVLPGNVPSIGFEATSTSEFGDLIALGGTERNAANLPATFVMSSWGCEAGGWTGADCVTTPGATFSVPITLKIYNADTSGAVPIPGTVVLTKTQTFDIPYRPSWDSTNCPADGDYHAWYYAATNTCYNGLAHAITFTLPAATLPDELIWTLSYNTADYGSNPTHVDGPINSLNVGTKTFTGLPALGTDVDPASAFLSSTWAGAYKDNGAGGTGKLRYDVNGWNGYAPLACFGTCAITNPVSAPTASPTAVPTEEVGGATGTPLSATLPPTSTGGSSSGGGSGFLALSICAAFAAVGLLAVGVQRRTVRG